MKIVVKLSCGLNNFGSEMFWRMPTLYCYLRCEDLWSPGVMEWRNGPLGLRDDDDYDEGWNTCVKNGR